MYIYSWPLNNGGLNCTSPLIYGFFFFSVTQFTWLVRFKPVLFKSQPVLGNLCMQWTDLSYIWILTVWVVSVPNPHAIQGSTTTIYMYIWMYIHICICVYAIFLTVPSWLSFSLHYYFPVSNTSSFCSVYPKLSSFFFFLSLKHYICAHGFKHQILIYA